MRFCPFHEAHIPFYIITIHTMTSHIEKPKAASLTVALLQTDIALTSAEENVRRALHLMDRTPGADLYVLPEMWGTGFNPRPGIREQEEAAQALTWMAAEAANRQCAVAGSLPVFDKAGNKWRNRFYFITPNGTFHYDKRHLFAPGGEAENYTAGTRRTVVEWRGWRILLQVCYDLRFPVFARNRDEYDFALYVANWPASRQEVWRVLLRARAIENQCYVAGVNRVGTDMFGTTYAGGTELIDAKGNVVAATNDAGHEEAVCTQLDIDGLRRFRQKFPVLADADDFQLSLS